MVCLSGGDTQGWKENHPSKQEAPIPATTQTLSAAEKIREGEGLAPGDGNFHPEHGRRGRRRRTARLKSGMVQKEAPQTSFSTPRPVQSLALLLPAPISAKYFIFFIGTHSRMGKQNSKLDL